MTGFHNEKVISMPPTSTKKVEILAASALAQLQPDALERPTPVDVIRLIDRVLPGYGVHFYPVTHEELPNEEAVTDHNDYGRGEINVLLREDQEAKRRAGGRGANRPRITVLHELGHVVMHVHVIRRRQAHPRSEVLLARKADVPAYMHPEWQAWAFAGCFAVPRKTLMMMTGATRSELSDTYHVSKDVIEKQLRRLKLEEAFPRQ